MDMNEVVPKTFLVTGGCGFIGSHVVDKLITRGDKVIVVDNLSTGTLDNLNQDAVFYQGDVSDRVFMEKIFSQHRIDYVIHEAAKINTSILEEEAVLDVRTSILGTINIADLCLEFGVDRLIYASSVAVYGRPDDLPVNEDVPARPVYSYGIAKHCAEEYLLYYGKNRNLNCHVLRYGNVYGPRQPVYGEVGVIAIYSVRAANGEPLIVYGDGEHVRDYIYVSDAVDATLMSIEMPGNSVLNVARGEGVSVNRVYEVFQRICNRPLQRLQRAERIGELGRFYCDISKMRNALSWSPEKTIEMGIFETLKYYGLADDSSD